MVRRLATAAFGRAGAELIPLLDKVGNEGLNNLTQYAIAAVGENPTTIKARWGRQSCGVDQPAVSTTTPAAQAGFSGYCFIVESVTAQLRSLDSGG
ncbi:MAG: hypothetical protein ACREPP_05860 [Rhodanobacteraceae bacterium]